MNRLKIGAIGCRSQFFESLKLGASSLNRDDWLIGGLKTLLKAP